MHTYTHTKLRRFHNVFSLPRNPCLLLALHRTRGHSGIANLIAGKSDRWCTIMLALTAGRQQEVDICSISESEIVVGKPVALGMIIACWESVGRIV